MSKPAGSATGSKYYRPGEVAKILRCSEWWIKEQARKRRIPYSWIGGSYLFTDEHIEQIVKLFETRPKEEQMSAVEETPTVPQSRREISVAPTMLLTARKPRRARSAQSAA